MVISTMALTSQEISHPMVLKNNGGYVKDGSTYAGGMTNDINTADKVVTRLSTGAQEWANLCNVIAQSIAFHKCIV